MRNAFRLVTMGKYQNPILFFARKLLCILIAYPHFFLTNEKDKMKKKVNVCFALFNILFPYPFYKQKLQLILERPCNMNADSMWRMN